MTGQRVLCEDLATMDTFQSLVDYLSSGHLVFNLTLLEPKRYPRSPPGFTEREAITAMTTTIYASKTAHPR